MSETPASKRQPKALGLEQIRQVASDLRSTEWLRMGVAAVLVLMLCGLACSGIALSGFIVYYHSWSNQPFPDAAWTGSVWIAAAAIFTRVVLAKVESLARPLWLDVMRDDMKSGSGGTVTAAFAKLLYSVARLFQKLTFNMQGNERILPGVKGASKVLKAVAEDEGRD